ncbi:MAG: helix-turn-helix transcriptional regulator [Bryobacterales bacterium]
MSCRFSRARLNSALHRLENGGWLSADWKTSENGRDAKYYKLDPRGRKRLESETADWQRLSQAVALILETA